MASSELKLVSAQALPTCKFCLNEQTKVCIRCQSRFCTIHAAKFSPNFCKDCLTNLAATIERFQRTSTEYDALDDKLVTHTSTGTQIKIDGPDWVFYQAWIEQLSDDELREIYEFHYFVLKIIEYDNETRKVKKAKKLATAPTPLSISTTKEARTK